MITCFNFLLKEGTLKSGSALAIQITFNSLDGDITVSQGKQSLI